MPASQKAPDQGIDAISTGNAKITDEAYVKGAEKFLEIANLGAFSSSALTTKLSAGL